MSEEKRITYIYTLSDPDTREVRYIGKSVDPASRFLSHCRRSKKSHRLPVNRWIAALQNRGLRPTIEIIDQTSGDWAALERHYIAKMRQEGRSLLNVTDGGEGHTGKKTATHIRNVALGLSRANFGVPTGRSPLKQARESARSPASRAKKSRTYIITDASGAEATIRNLAQFCREHGLCPATMTQIASGSNPRRKSHKGYRVRYADTEIYGDGSIFDFRDTRRREGMRLIERGDLLPKEIAERLQVSPSTVLAWKHLYIESQSHSSQG